MLSMKWFALPLMLVLAFCGLTNALYLATAVSEGQSLLCPIDPAGDCNAVLASPYARVGGVPLPYYGAFFFGLMFVLVAIELAYSMRVVRRTLQGLAAVGVIISAYLVFLQYSVIGVACSYCLVSAIASFGIFVLAYFIESLEQVPVASRSSVVSTMIAPPLS